MSESTIFPFLLHHQKQPKLLPTPMPKGSLICGQTPDEKHSDYITFSDNGIKTNKHVETHSCSLENSIKAKRCKPYRTQRTQSMVREGMRKNMGEVSSAIFTGLFPSYHKCLDPGPPSLRSISPGLFGGGLVNKSWPTLSTLWAVACQAPLSMGFSRQESWSGLPLFSPHKICRLAPSFTQCHYGQ